MQGNQRLGVISGAGTVCDTLRAPRSRSARPADAPRPLPERRGRGGLSRGGPAGRHRRGPVIRHKPAQAAAGAERTLSLGEPEAGSPRSSSGVSPHLPASSPAASPCPRSRLLPAYLPPHRPSRFQSIPSTRPGVPRWCGCGCVASRPSSGRALI